MSGRRVVMGLLFYPRGGSAYVVRYLSPALARAGWSVSLAVGSLGGPGDETHAPTFFDGLDVHCVDATDAVRAFEAAGDATAAIAAPQPMHPSYEDRAGVPDVVFASVPPELAEHLVSVWELPFRAAGAERADVFHLHHLTPQLDAAHRAWPEVPVVVHLHGTEMKLLEAIDERIALATTLGETLETMPAAAERLAATTGDLDDAQVAMLRTTRWDFWRHGEFWSDRMKRQVRPGRPPDHGVTPEPGERDREVRDRARTRDRDPQRCRHRALPAAAPHARCPARRVPARARRRSAGLDRARAARRRSRTPTPISIACSVSTTTPPSCSSSGASSDSSVCPHWSARSPGRATGSPGPARS